MNSCFSNKEEGKTICRDKIEHPELRVRDGEWKRVAGNNLVSVKTGSYRSFAGKFDSLDQ